MARREGSAIPGAWSSANRPPFYGWVLVVVLGLTTTISYGTTAYLFGVLVVPMGDELGWNRGTLSGAYAVGQILAGLAGFPIGRLVDRYGPRLLMALGSALGGLALIGLAAVHELWQFYALWGGVLGLSMALTYYPVTFTVIANWFSRKRGSAMAWLTLLGGLASPIFVPLSGVLVDQLGWRGAVVVLGAAQLTLALPMHALFLRRHPEDVGLLPDGEPRGAEEPPTPGGLVLDEALRRPAFWILTGANAVGALTAQVVWVHSVALMLGRGVEPVAAASIAGLIGLSSLPGRYLLNVLSDRLGAQPLLGVCIAVQALGLLVLVFGPAPGGLYAYAVVYGLAFGAVNPLRASVMADHFGRRAYGAITAVQGVPVAFAAGLGPVLAGVLFDAYRSYDLAFLSIAAGLVAASVAVLLTPRPAVALAPARSI